MLAVIEAMHVLWCQGVVIALLMVEGVFVSVGAGRRRRGTCKEERKAAGEVGKWGTRPVRGEHINDSINVMM